MTARSPLAYDTADTTTEELPMPIPMTTAPMTTTPMTTTTRHAAALAAELDVAPEEAQQWADEWIDRRAEEIIHAARQTARYQAIDEFERASVAELLYGDVEDAGR